MKQDIMKMVGDEINADIVLCTAIDVGEHLLKNGSEISRVENTIERICFALGAAYVEAFAIPSLIAASVRMKDGTYSEQMRHIQSASMNLYRIEKLNTISRELCSGEITISEAREKIEKFKRSFPYKNFVSHIGAFIFVWGFTIVFGGSWSDAFCGGVIGVLVSLLSGLDVPFNRGMMKPMLASFVAGSFAVLFCWIGMGQNVDSIAIGTIMQVIPGLSFWTGVTDMVNGNIISGALRLLQAVITAVMIALGYAIAFFVLGGLM